MEVSFEWTKINGAIVVAILVDRSVERPFGGPDSRRRNAAEPRAVWGHSRRPTPVG